MNFAFLGGGDGMGGRGWEGRGLGECKVCVGMQC